MHRGGEGKWETNERGEGGREGEKGGEERERRGARRGREREERERGRERERSRERERAGERDSRGVEQRESGSRGKLWREARACGEGAPEMQKATDGAVAHHVVQHTAFPARKPVEHCVVGAADENVAPHLGQGLGQLACESRGDRDGRKTCDCERRAGDALARRGGAECIAGSASGAQGATFDRNPCQANILTGKAHMCGKQRINRLCASDRCEKEDAMLFPRSPSWVGGMA